MGYTPQLSAAVWVGYPDAGVAMPGAQGGEYAAPVWNAFMTPAHGDFCEDFAYPEEPFVSSPFFGKYSSTGGADTGDYYYDDGTTDDGSDPEYDPDLYESAPQEAPEVAPPAEDVAPAPPTGAPPEGGTGGGVTPGDGGPLASSTDRADPLVPRGLCIAGAALERADAPCEVPPARRPSIARVDDVHCSWPPTHPRRGGKAMAHPPLVRSRGDGADPSRPKCRRPARRLRRG